MEAATEPILVVEDDPDVRDALVLLLEREGYSVTCADNGQEALERLRAAPSALVILDLMLPVMDGFEFRVQQLQDPVIARVPVIVLSSGGDLSRKVEPLHVEACLSKPLDLERLLGVVARRMGRPGQNACPNDR
jgi:two-component system, chemotaxis family, chemotaxis protein CheY